MSNIKLYLIKYEIPTLNRLGIATVAASSPKQAQDYLQAQGKYNGYKYDMNYPIIVHTTDTWTAAAIISEIDNPVGEKGDRGPRGLKGDKGDKGDKGEKGDPLTWDSMDPEDKITLKEDIEENVKNDLKNGYNPSMTVGKAENLVGRGESTEEEFSFRPSAGALSIEDGSAKITSIKGNSVVWNQQIKTLIVGGHDEIVKNGITFKKTPNGYHISGDNNTSSHAFSNDSGNLSVKANHYYLFDIVGCDKSYINIYLSGIGFSLNGRISEIKQSKKDGNAIVRLTVAPNTTVVDEYVSCQVIDLTQMFGDGNEPATVEAYYQRKPMNIADEFAYNAGTIVDMKVDSLISTSDNAYDYVKGYARVMGRQTYDCSYGSAFVEKVYFSTDKDNIVAEENAMTSENGKYTFPSDGYAVPYTTDGDVREYCVCLQHSYTKPHPAYQQEVKDLSFISEAFSEGMRSISMKKDANNTNINADIYDEIRFNPTTNKWKVIKRIGVADLGSLDISYSAGTGCFLTTGNSRFFKPYSPILSSVYTFIRNGNPTTLPDMHISSSPYFNKGVLFLKNSAYTDVASFKQAMQEQGVTLYYELAEPEVTELDIDFTPYYEIWDFGTEEAIASGASTPFRADIVYLFNAVDRIRNNSAKIAELEAKIQSLTLVISALQTNE